MAWLKIGLFILLVVVAIVVALIVIAEYCGKYNKFCE